LFVNFTGELQVEILDTPFRATVTGDSTHQLIRWQGATDLSVLAGRPVKFRFQLTNGKLYSFWVSPDTTGISRGYVAAGGPGFTGPTDGK
jgi:hypothetical protein